MNGTGRQRRRAWQQVLLISCALFLLVLVRLPASILAEMLASRCAQRCLLAVPEGQLWQGSGRLFLRAAPDAAWHDLGEIRWGPERVLSGLWRIDLAGGSIRVAPHPLGIVLKAENLQLARPMRFPLIWPGLPGSGWSGRIGIRHGQWHYVLAEGWSGEAEIEGSELVLDLLPERNLPPLTVHWAFAVASGGRLAFGSRESAALRLAGEATLTREGRARAIDARIEIAPDASTPLRQLLSAIAVADAARPGHYRIAHDFE